MVPIFTRIVRPYEQHHVATPQAYVNWLVAAYLNATLKMTRDGIELAHPKPYVSDRVVVPRIRQGCWIVLCAGTLNGTPCANAPAYDPEWRLACCLDCAAIYQGVAPPDGWQRIEAILMKRPVMVSRNWEPMETMSDLVRENLAAALEVA